MAPCALLSVCVTPVSTRTRSRLCPAPARAAAPLHVLVPVLPGHRGPGVASIHGPAHHPCTLAPVGHDCHQVTLLDPLTIGRLVEITPSVHRKDRHTNTKKKTPTCVTGTAHSTPAGKAGCAHPVGLGLIKPAGLAVRPRALPGGPTITPAGREDTKHSMHRREASESSTVFPARLSADKLYKPSKARLLGWAQERQFTLYHWFHRAGSLEKFWFQSNFTIVTDCNVIHFPICQPI